MLSALEGSVCRFAAWRPMCCPPSSLLVCAVIFYTLSPIQAVHNVAVIGLHNPRGVFVLCKEPPPLSPLQRTTVQSRFAPPKKEIVAPHALGECQGVDRRHRYPLPTSISLCNRCHLFAVEILAQRGGELSQGLTATGRASRLWCVCLTGGFHWRFLWKNWTAPLVVPLANQIVCSPPTCR